MSDSRGLQLYITNDQRLLMSSRPGVPIPEHTSRYSMTPSSTRRRSVRHSQVAPRNSFGIRGSAVGTTTIAGTSLHRKSSLTHKGPQLLNSSLQLQEARIRNRAYMELLLREVHDFCMANKFEEEMKCRIPLSKYDKLTQRDFLNLFSFLYGKLDPNYNNVVHEGEIKPLLKGISYPGVEKIRDVSSATGEQNWPHSLAMLYWLVKLNLMLLTVNDETEFIAPTAPVQKIFYPSIFSSYACFMEGRPDDKEQELLLEHFNEFKNEVALRKQETKETLDKLSKEKVLLSTEFKKIDEAEDMTGKLETDIRSLNKYIGDLKEGYDVFKLKNDTLKSSIANLESKMKQIYEAKDIYVLTLRNKGIDMDQLAKIEQEETRIRRNTEVAYEKLKNTKDKITKAQDKLLRATQDLDLSVDRYNTTVHQIPLLAELDDLEYNEQIIHDFGGRFDADSILSRSLRKEKELIAGIDANIKSETLANEEEHMFVLQQIEEFKQTLLDYNHKIEDLEMILANERDDNAKMHDKKLADAKSFENQIKNLENIIDGMKTEMKFEIFEAQTMNANLTQQLAKTQSVNENRREILLLTVHGNLGSILTMKDHVEKALESLKSLASKELENEKRKETGI